MKDINTFLEYLTNIEHVFDETTYVKGEELLDSAEISTVSQKNSLFVIQVIDKQPFEVELRISSKKLNKHTCDCEDFQKKRLCAHITASYLFLRRRLLKQQDLPKKPKRTNHVKRKSIREVIQNVPQIDLATFVQSYAKKDKKFSTAIRVHFLSQNKIINLETIRIILDSIVPPVTTATRKLPNSDWLLFIRTLDDFMEQIKDAISVSNFEFASNLLTASMTKMYYLISKFGIKEVQSRDYLERLTELSRKLFEELEAPLAKEKMAKSFLTIQEKSYFHTYISYDFIHTLLDNDLLSKSQIKSVVEKLLSATYEFDKDRVHGLSLATRLSTSIPNLFQEVIETLNVDLYSKIIDEIFEEQDFATLKLLFVHPSFRLNQVLKTEYEYKTAIHENDYTTAFNALFSLIEQTKNIQFYEKLKDLYPENINKTQLKKVKTMINSWEVEDQLAYYLFEERFEELCKSLLKVNKVEVSFIYDKSVPVEFDDTLFELYKLHIKDYLESHVGNLSTDMISKILSHIQSYKSRELYGKVSNYITTEYGDRKSIKTLLSSRY